MIIYSELFKKFPEIICGISTKAGGVSSFPYCMNLSYKVGDKIENVNKNREIFFRELGIQKDLLSYQSQVHSADSYYVSKPYYFKQSDALFTDKKNLFLSVTVADCIPVFLYDKSQKIIAAIHAGWKGTQLKIVSRTIEKLKKNYGLNPSECFVFIGPGISAENFEVGENVFELFPENVRIENAGKYFVDLKNYNNIQIIDSGVKPENIEISEYCTYKEKDLLHSYRRDKEKSGRMLGVIGMV